MRLKIARLVAKLLGHRNFKVTPGHLNIWAVPMFFHSSETMPCMLHDCRQMKEAYYYLGKLQSLNGTNILIKRFGLEKNKKSFMQLFVDQGVMLGLGKGGFRIKDDNGHVDFYAYLYFPKTYKKKYGMQKEAVCHYMRGLLAGGVEAIYSPEKKIYAVETECIAKGDERCFFEIKPEEECDSKEFRQQYSQEPPYYERFKKIENMRQLLDER
ncbi:MAG: V4R domain-containing protein [Candidatus Nanoarchaeia archaeon]